MFLMQVEGLNPAGAREISTCDGIGNQRHLSDQTERCTKMCMHRVLSKCFGRRFSPTATSEVRRYWPRVHVRKQKRVVSPPGKSEPMGSLRTCSSCPPPVSVYIFCVFQRIICSAHYSYNRLIYVRHLTRENHEQLV